MRFFILSTYLHVKFTCAQVNERDQPPCRHRHAPTAILKLMPLPNSDIAITSVKQIELMVFSKFRGVACFDGKVLVPMWNITQLRLFKLSVFSSICKSEFGYVKRYLHQINNEKYEDSIELNRRNKFWSWMWVAPSKD